MATWKNTVEQLHDARGYRILHQVPIHGLRGRVSGGLFSEGPNFLVIDPDECIDCAVCIPECPVNAIYAEEDIPADQRPFIAINVELAKGWPSITRMKPHFPDSDDWKDTPNKLQYLEK